MSIRRAVPEDVPALDALIEDAFAPYVTRIGLRPAPMEADHAAAVADGTVWVATRAGAVVGCTRLLPGADHVQVEDVAVARAERGHGTGRLLLDHAREWARVRGCAELRLYTNAAMTDNLTFYRHLGWTETHRGDQDGYSRVFYRLRVDATASPRT